MIGVLLALHLVALVQAANWNTNVRILATERLDPIISPNGVASHMHSIIGGSAFGASYNQPDLMKSKCTSFPISIDKSNYWHPKPYWINNNGTSFTPLPISNRVYYIREKNSPNDWIRPFPEGLRMIVGSPFSKAPDARSFQYLCRVADKFNGPGDIWSDHWNFERDCPRGILAQHKFPPCWDGVNLYKSDQSHMAFPQWGAHYGACPASHPIRLPGIMLEVYIQTYRWAPGETIKGKLAWANGDTTGYGIHADFTNGWDTTILGRALNDTTCGTSDDITFQECPVFQPFITDGPCSPDKGVLAEATQHVDMIPISRLPGCNPLWGSGAKPGCSSTTPDPDPTAFRGTDGPLIASQSAVSALPTVPGWKTISCIKDSDNMLLNKVRTYDSNVSQTSCLDSCLRSGYSYASIGYAWGQSWVCDCGTGLDPKASTYPGMCNMTCPANVTQGCGGSGAHSVFYAPNNTKTVGDYTASLGCYANPPAGKIGLQDVASYNFTSWNLMTRELCGQACADRKLDWAGIKSGGICYCGSAATFNLGSGNYVNEALCTDKCAGNKTQACGYWGGLSVFNVTSSGYKTSVLKKPAGYIQCFADGSRTSLTGAQYWDGSLTPEKCQFGCRDLGFALASVYNGNMCMCGDKLGNVATLPTSMCSTKCSDNSTAYTCGGPGNGELYETSAVSAQVTAFNAKRPPGWQGCYSNPANNVTADITVNESRLTVTRCIAACGELGYSWAGVQNREQCRCSKADPRINTKAVAANNYCVIPCNGDAGQQCGGWNNVDLYFNPTLPVAVNATNPSDNGVPVLAGYKGCFNGSSALPAYQWWSGQMTVDLCQQGCKEIGQPLSALSAGTCSCGSTWTGGSRLTSLSCGSACGGNPNQRCGGWPGQTSLYDSAAGADTPSPPDYMGCWSETTPKTLQGFGVWSDAQSVDSCRSICKTKGFAISGLTNGKQCWCGNSIGTASTRVPSQFCATPCPGNAAQNCGQWNTIALYRSDTGALAAASNFSAPAMSTNASASTSQFTISRSSATAASLISLSATARNVTSAASSTTTATRATSSSSSLPGSAKMSPASSGASSALSRSASSAVSSAVASLSSSVTGASTFPTCIADLSTLTGPKYTSNFMTRNACVFWCKGKNFAFAGVSGNTCVCGNVRPTKTATTCSTLCSGDRTQTCGGSSVASVLLTNSTAGLIDPYISPDAAGNMGCWVTYSSTRLIGAASFTNSSMTRAMCAAGCQARGFRFAGTQSSTQCWCGTALDPASNNYRVANSDCNYKCGGDSGMCGGNSRLSIFDGSLVSAGTAAPAAVPATNVTVAGSSTLSVLSSRSSASSSIPRSTLSSIPGTATIAATASRAGNLSALMTSMTQSSTRQASTPVQLPSTASKTSSLTATSGKSSSSFSATSSLISSAEPSIRASINSTADYLGCFAEQASARVYAAWNTTSTTMTAQGCQAACLGRDRSYTYFGIQLGNQCWCAIEPPNLATNKLLDDALCNYPCIGDQTQKCGGNSTVSAWGPIGAAKRLAASGIVRRRRRTLRPARH